MVLDYEKGLEQVGGDESLLKEVLGIFIEDVPRKLSELREGLMQEDREKIRRAGHSLKGASANIAADAVQKVAFDIEKMAAESDFDTIRETIGLLEDEIGKLQAAIDLVLGK